MKNSGVLIVKKILFPMMFILSIAYLILSWRWTAALLLPVVIILYSSLYFHKNFKVVLFSWCLYLLLILLPVDITFLDYEGPPKLVPFISGLPNAKAKQLEEEGKIVIGSDLITGNEPKWVIVW
jgi:hypothetical protein